MKITITRMNWIFIMQIYDYMLSGFQDFVKILNQNELGSIKPTVPPTQSKSLL